MNVNTNTFQTGLGCNLEQHMLLKQKPSEKENFPSRGIN
jgi:hypothetical protein